MKAASPRVLFIDIETAPILAAIWTIYEANAVWVERDTYIMSFAYRWQHEKRTKTICLPDYAGYERRKHCDKLLCRDLHDLLDNADIVVAHNGDAFDIKKINSRLIVNGLQPPSPYKTVDTLKVARKAFKFDSNKLDNLGRYLKEGRKIPNTGAELWRGCVNGDTKSWKTLRRYNAQDVDLLVRVYDRLKSWAPHPNMTIYEGRSGCPTCKSIRVTKQGVKVCKTRKYQQFKCIDCGSWFSGKAL